MAITPIRPAQLSSERRRGVVDRQLSVQDGVAHLQYSLAFTGAGEAAIEVNFPCRFIDVPAVTSGFTLAPGTVLEDRNFPWASAGIDLKSEVVGGRDYYVGGTIVVVMGGSRLQRMTVHCVAVGKAITAPVT